MVEEFSAAVPSLSVPVRRADKAATASARRVLLASIPAALAPNTPLAPSPADLPVPAAQVAPADAQASASVPALAVLADGPASVDLVPAALAVPAAHLLRVRLRAHPAAPPPEAVAVAASSTPRPRKAR